ncbi:hypothetical protein DID88_005120 [Monilinia fructigena]|uniref:Uncharacterized protein n=1 Tax=Monilinia fructigena TaxID=38457 RepID=A0A395IDG5_9HELO|nr:hypothetical protein DID88_005120 [Monilinia fructigena]
MVPSKRCYKAAININNDGQILNGGQSSAGVIPRDRLPKNIQSTDLHVNGEPPRAQPPTVLGIINAGDNTGQPPINHSANGSARPSRQSSVSNDGWGSPARAPNHPQSQFVIPPSQMDQGTFRPSRLDSREASGVYRPVALRGGLQNREHFQSQSSASTVYVPIHINSPENQSTSSIRPSSILPNSSNAYQPSLLGAPNQPARGQNFPANQTFFKIYPKRPGNWSGIRGAEAQEELRNPRGQPAAHVDQRQNPEWHRARMNKAMQKAGKRINRNAGFRGLLQPGAPVPTLAGLASGSLPNNCLGPPPISPQER